MKKIVYNKYKILDAKTGKEKKGEYFVLKIDSKDSVEASIVVGTLSNYAYMQHTVGRNDYAISILNYLREAQKLKGANK